MSTGKSSSNDTAEHGSVGLFFFLLALSIWVLWVAWPLWLLLIPPAAVFLIVRDPDAAAATAGRRLIIKVCVALMGLVGLVLIVHCGMVIYDFFTSEP